MFRRVILALVSLALLCGPAAAAEKFIVASDCTWPPMEMLDANKQPEGFSTDYLRAMGKAAGFEVEVRNIAWDGIFGGVAIGQYDIVASSVTITPERQQQFDFSAPYYEVVQAVADFLQQRVDALGKLGVARDRMVLDPGVGFGKTVPQNLALLKEQAHLQAGGHAVLAGWSRKSTLGAVLEALPVGITDAAYRSELLPHERSLASVAAALLAVEKGARVVRVHDVAAVQQALAVEAERQPLSHNVVDPGLQHGGDIVVIDRRGDDKQITRA